ncbi:hypothetical protein IGS73_14260 [Janibacter indicus]|uniref:DUF6801 domain-containing protein n=1 Tax=Janibacter indicus TaxID=857417 RepID=A0A7L9IZU4_9MICO|nr:DUF6801 domain-containing protein [Janibacter indicus]QOK22245.1 hypothetical protein IGS73_14260 [Janibacter indicus]
MAKRLTARLSAGAALVTGLGLAGIAVSVPAQAATTLNYSCTTPLGPQTLAVALDTDAPETTSVGTDLSVTPSGTVTLNSALANGMAGALQWQDVRADIPDVEATLSDGTESATFTTDLSIARTTIFKDNAWTQDDTPDLPISGDAIAVTPEVAGTYTISAPDSFTATFHGYDAAGEAGTLSPIESTCTYVDGDKVIDTVTVEEEAEPTPTTSEPTTSEPTTSEPTTSEPTTSEPTTSEPTTSEPTTSEPTTSEPTTSTPAPEVNDWFNEPGSLPITDDGKSFTVEGTADQAGVVSVVLLDESKKVLRTITWNVTEGSNTRDFPFAEGTDYVRLVSEDCVDSNGNDGSVAGGCNVEYYAPWVNPDSDDDDNSGDDDGAGSGSAGPETPGVVQTDGFTRVEEPAGTNSAALLLGGALLAGAGAGSVVLVRRRQAAQH